jgi:hypothetical protein
MDFEDEIVGIRRRRAELERALLHVDDPMAITLIKFVIEDMDARIAALETTTQPQSEGAVKPAPALQQQQPQPHTDQTNRAGEDDEKS